MSRRRPTYVLGTGLSHNGSACLLRDGRIAVAIEKERITRRKHDGGNDNAAIAYCLEAEGIGLSDVAVVVQNANFGMFTQGNGWFNGPRIVGEAPRVVTISHHLAHAYCAIYTSPFTRGAALIIDGCGNGFDECSRAEQRVAAERPPKGCEHLYHEKDSYYAFDEKGVRPLFKDFSPWGFFIRQIPMCPPSTLHSIGGVYNAVSHYVFAGVDDVGKLMGLAPYGGPGRYSFKMFDLVGGRVFLRTDWMNAFDAPCRVQGDYVKRFQEMADLAWWVQREIERAVLYVVRARYKRWPAENLVYAGGVALNAVANRRIAEEGPFENLYMAPAAGDNGLAVGCAFYGWTEVLGRPRVPHDGTSWFGRTYGSSEISRVLRRFADQLEVRRSTSIEEETAALLAKGKVVGWFQGGSELGPRALGRRSILADPRRPGVRDHINAKIKFREDFRPFAPAVTLEDASTYFECEGPSPYMILVVPTRRAWRRRIPAVVHRDGSARVQTVTASSDPRFHRLLKAFEAEVGIPILLNTSFNRRGMPIVETPREAIELFLECALDVLVIGDLVITARGRRRPYDGSRRTSGRTHMPKTRAATG